MLRTARKRVPCHTTIKIKSRQPDHDFEPTIGSTSDPMIEGAILSADSDAESEAPKVVKLAFDPHPNHELWERFRELYLYRYDIWTRSSDRYFSFLASVGNLYDQRVELGLVREDHIWIQTTLAYFPNFSSWVEEKNRIIAQGPFEFDSFLVHMIRCVKSYMDW